MRIPDFSPPRYSGVSQLKDGVAVKQSFIFVNLIPTIVYRNSLQLL